MKFSKYAYFGSVSCWLSAIGIAFLITLGLSGNLITTNQLSLPPAVQRQEYWRLVQYLLTPGQTLSFHALALSSRATHHFAEVKGLIQVGMLVGYLSIGGSWFTWRQLKKRGQLWQLSTVLKYSLVGGLIILVMVSVDFENWFWQFHQMVFPNHDWIFNPTRDQIINLLPSSFFFWFLLIWSSITSLLLGSLVGIANYQTEQLVSQLRTQPTNHGGNQGNHNDADDNQ